MNKICYFNVRGLGEIKQLKKYVSYLIISKITLHKNWNVEKGMGIEYVSMWRHFENSKGIGILLSKSIL